jgi:hypothetical protein
MITGMQANRFEDEIHVGLGLMGGIEHLDHLSRS